ncbi:N-acetyltransferase [Streptomyces sp. T1317-0309]|nr:N-acetyltransferase [Streptomyces sp. T1317-0309]
MSRRRHRALPRSSRGARRPRTLRSPRGERIVGTSVLLDRDGVAGVYVVTTAEEYRGRGLGTALTTEALTRGGKRDCESAPFRPAPPGRCTNAWGFKQ